MKRVLLALLAILLLPAVSLDAKAPKSKLNSVHFSVVKIYHDSLADGHNHQCSAVAVNPVTYISAYHCLGGDLSGEFEVIKGRDINVPGVSFAVDPTNDLLAIRTEAAVAPGLSAGPDPEDGTLLFSFGYPYDGPDVMVTSGEVLGIGVIDGLEGTKMFLNSQIYPGMSGGPTVDHEGRITGVNQGYVPGIVSVISDWTATSAFIHKIN